MTAKAKTAVRRPAMLKYIAFLRGINVGGHKPIKMEALAKAFASLGFQNVKTVLASGNVLFESRELDPLRLPRQLNDAAARVPGAKTVTLTVLRLNPEKHGVPELVPLPALAWELSGRLR